MQFDAGRRRAIGVTGRRECGVRVQAGKNVRSFLQRGAVDGFGHQGLAGRVTRGKPGVELGNGFGNVRHGELSDVSRTGSG